MKKESFWRNSSIQMATLAGLAATLAVYLILTSGAFSSRQSEFASGKAKQAERETVIRQDSEETVTNKQMVLIALRISDYEILKSRLKKGVRINIVSGYNVGQNSALQVRTLFENILVADVPVASSSRLSSGEQGILIEVTEEEGERLAGVADSGPLRIVIKKD